MRTNIATTVFPCFLIWILLYSLWKKNDAISSFVTGAKNGISVIFSILPNILAITVAAAIFRSSGALDFFLKLLTPVFQMLSVPPGISELILLRPVSGSGAMVLLSDILNRFGADSFEGLAASVICASTETTLYTVMVYFGVTKVKKTAFPLTIGLLCDILTVLMSVLAVKLFFAIA